MMVLVAFELLTCCRLLEGEKANWRGGLQVLLSLPVRQPTVKRIWGKGWGGQSSRGSCELL